MFAVGSTIPPWEYPKQESLPEPLGRKYPKISLAHSAA